MSEKSEILVRTREIINELCTNKNWSLNQIYLKSNLSWPVLKKILDEDPEKVYVQNVTLKKMSKFIEHYNSGMYKPRKGSYSIRSNGNKEFDTEIPESMQDAIPEPNMKGEHTIVDHDPTTTKVQKVSEVQPEKQPANTDEQEKVPEMPKVQEMIQANLFDENRKLASFIDKKANSLTLLDEVDNLQNRFKEAGWLLEVKLTKIITVICLICITIMANSQDRTLTGIGGQLYAGNTVFDQMAQDKGFRLSGSLSYTNDSLYIVFRRSFIERWNMITYRVDSVTIDMDERFMEATLYLQPTSENGPDSARMLTDGEDLWLSVYYRQLTFFFASKVY